jgi:hypothetical protein
LRWVGHDFAIFLRATTSSLDLFYRIVFKTAPRHHRFCNPLQQGLLGMKINIAICVIVASLSVPAAALGQTRAQEEQACQDDAFRLCPDEIPDETQVYNCMTRKKAKLSPACRAMFAPPSRRR